MTTFQSLFNTINSNGSDPDVGVLGNGVQALPVIIMDAAGSEVNVAPSFSTGQKTAITTAVALAGSTACREVMVQADPANSARLLVGDSTNQYFSLAAGESISIPTSNLNLVYVKAASGTLVANYISRL